jgi:hypothetical protein
MDMIALSEAADTAQTPFRPSVEHDRVPLPPFPPLVLSALLASSRFLLPAAKGVICWQNPSALIHHPQAKPSLNSVSISPM